MAVQYPIQDEQQRRQGENPLIANMPTSSRADRMQAQYNQPVTGPRGTTQPASAGVPQSIRQDSAGIGRMVTGALSLPVAAAREGIGNIGTDIANVGRTAIGGQPEPRPGYPRTAALAQQTRDGAAAFAGANRNLLAGAQSALRDATGTRAAPPSGVLAIGQDMPTAVDTPNPTGKPGSTNRPSAPAQAGPVAAPNAQPESEYMKTGIDGIAMRRGAGGVPEFTNDQTAVAGAGAMPRGGIGNIGNGIGAATFGNDGDSRLALERFERANQIRAQSIAENRGRELGDNGGRLTVVRDSSRTPTLQERQLARLEQRQAETEALRSQSQQGILAGMDERLTNQLNRQKTQQEIETGRAGLENQQRIADLRSMIADTTLPVEQRQAAEQAYNALTLSPADRYMTVQGGTNEFGGKDASKVFDRLTGREVGKTDNPSMAADLEQARRVIAADPGKRAEVEKRLQQAYGRGLDG